MIETADGAVTTARRLLDLFQQDRQRLLPEAASVLRPHEALQRNPLISIPRAATLTGTSQPTATKAIRKLEAQGIVREVTGTNYGKLYTYTGYLDILNEET